MSLRGLRTGIGLSPHISTQRSRPWTIVCSEVRHKQISGRCVRQSLKSCLLRDSSNGNLCSWEHGRPLTKLYLPPSYAFQWWKKSIRFCPLLSDSFWPVLKWYRNHFNISFKEKHVPMSWTPTTALTPHSECLCFEGKIGSVNYIFPSLNDTVHISTDKSEFNGCDSVGLMMVSLLQR